MRYILHLHDSGEIVECNNKAVLVRRANRYGGRATIEDTACWGIVYENRQQRKANNAE